MGRRPRPLVEVEAERQRVLELHAEGLDQVEIGELLGLHKSSVGRHLSLRENAWRFAVAADYQTAEGQQLAHVRTMLRATWALWRASADAGYLEVIRWCLERERELLGLTAAPAWILEQEMAVVLEQASGNPDQGL